jgi:hypothetical protein
VPFAEKISLGLYKNALAYCGKVEIRQKKFYSFEPRQTDANFEPSVSLERPPLLPEKHFAD